MLNCVNTTHVQFVKLYSSFAGGGEELARARAFTQSPSYGAHNVADFRHFQTEFSERITDKPWSLAIYPATNMFIWTRIVYKGRFKKCNLIQSAENDVTKRANLSKIGTFKPFINLVQTC